MSKLVESSQTTVQRCALQMHLDDFQRCKAYLAHRFALLVEQQRLLEKTSSAQLYTVGASLGIAPSMMAQAIATYLQLPYLAQVTSAEIKPGVLSVSFCRARLVIALQRRATPNAFVLCNPFDFELVDTLQQHASPQHPPQFFLTSPEVLTTLLKNAATLQSEQPSDKQTTPDEIVYDFLASVESEGVVELEAAPEYEVVDPQEVEKSGKLPPVVRLVNMILTDAVKAGASDIHIEPQESSVQVRFRIDGVLIEVLTIPKNLHPPLVSRLKIISRLDISEHRKPQDGRGRLRFEARHIDLRISILPTQLGQKVVIRLLDGNAALVRMDNLSFTSDTRRVFERLLNRTAGMILVTGPTGSGKSTTLYAALNWLKSPTKNIVTVENPVELQIPGITQVQIDVKAGMTFAAGLRSILRQDPDIILVGEVRDQETASIAIEASQTGHLLLSTLHTNDAPSTITRLLDLDIEPFKITSSLLGVVAQRLVRRVCPVCAVPCALDSELLAQLGNTIVLPAGDRWQTAAGCAACYQTGFKGRLAIHELLEMTEDIRELIHQQAPDHTIRHMARQHGMRTLLEDGIAKAAMGLTTLEEVLRVAPRLEAPKSPPRLLPSAAQKPATALAPTLSVRAAPAEPAGSPPATALAHLLVLEDDVDMQALLQLLLTKNGYAITIASDGIDALMHLGKQRFDLILSDVNMPNLDGIQLLEITKQKGVQLPVIFLTADSTEESELRCLELGAIDYIKKPIKKDLLLLRVQRALRDKRGV